MKKTADILLAIGIAIIIVGIAISIVVGFFNLVIAIPVFLLSVIAGGGCASIGGSLSEAQKEKADDLQLMNEIIEKVKNEG